jgi:hypothetical protein
MLVAMAQAYEVEPGDWYLRGLRSNPAAEQHQVAFAILGLKRAMAEELEKRGAKTARYGTLSYFKESLRLAAMLGFREHFRLCHAHHPIPEVPEVIEGVEVEVPGDASVLFDYLAQGSTVKPVEGYFFTWWDTRRLRLKYLEDAKDKGLLLRAVENGEMIGAAMYWHVPWQNFLVLSIMEGTDEALKALYRAGVMFGHTSGCNAIGMVHLSDDEMHRRQELFGLPTHGDFTVQLIYNRDV